MKTFLTIPLCLFLLTVSIGYSQNIGDLYQYEAMEGREILDYPELLERDVSWQKRVYRRIDVREKMNLRFIDEKNPFLNVLLEAIDDGVPFYGVKTKENVMARAEYAVPFTVNAQFPKDDITMKKKKGYMIDFSDTVSSVVSSADRSMTHKDWKPTDVVYYEIVEDWYVDDRYGKMQVRIAGIRPQLEFSTYDAIADATQFNELSYWVPYDLLRPYLAHAQAPNYDNGVHTISWDEIFQFRMFSSYIAKDDLTPQNQYLEDMFPNSSFRKKLSADEMFNELFMLEQSLWSY